MKKLLAQSVDDLIPPEDLLIGGSPVGHGSRLPDGDLIFDIVPAIIQNILLSLGALMFIALIVGGVLLVTAQGNEETLTKAKKLLAYAGAGVLLISLAYAMVIGLAQLDFTP